MNNKDKEMRQVYGDTILELFEQDKDIYALEADLSSSMSTSKLKSAMGSNYVNLGIMEANMISVAAGINLDGGFAFVHSFGQFIARRAMDQIFVSLAYAKLGACLVGSDAGVSAEHNGGTHMTFEDMGILRVIPEIKIYDVCDPVEFGIVLKRCYKEGGLSYIRTTRKKATHTIYDDNVDFGNKGANLLKEGKDVTIIACGIMVGESLEAARKLEQQGISCDVIDAFRIKPLDESVILESCKKTKLVVTCENHNIINGLGSAVTELLSEKAPCYVKRIGVQDRFGQVGKLDYLQKEYGLTSDDIFEQVKSIV